jgi:hypothetical protein
VVTNGVAAKEKHNTSCQNDLRRWTIRSRSVIDPQDGAASGHCWFGIRKQGRAAIDFWQSNGSMDVVGGGTRMGMRKRGGTGMGTRKRGARIGNKETTPSAMGMN